MGNSTSVAQDAQHVPEQIGTSVRHDTVQDASFTAAQLAVEDACCKELFGTVPMGHQRVVTIDGRWFAVFHVAPHNTIGAVELLAVDAPTASAMTTELPAVKDLRLPTGGAPSSRPCTPNELRTTAVTGMRHGADVNVLGVTRHLAPYIS